jgi:hypothetical protein
VAHNCKSSLPVAHSVEAEVEAASDAGDGPIGTMLEK